MTLHPLLDETALDAAVAAIRRAEALLFCAGAGMGVDSGLPDFRGNEGFWRAYPPFAARGLSFVEVAKPQWFRDDPALAWGFYGQRMHLYRATPPHEGFALLKQWGDAKPRGAFVFTSNVDGHFQKSGFEPSQVCEIHGSIGHLQCSVPCSNAIWSSANTHIRIDEQFLAQEPLPRCPHCGAMARPNILMFSDGKWVWNRTQEQEAALYRWTDALSGSPITVIECGAGGAVPTVRQFSEWMQRAGATLVRINPRESQGPKGTISLAGGALTALHTLADRLSEGAS